jgi:hypothetical protein
MTWMLLVAIFCTSAAVAAALSTVRNARLARGHRYRAEGAAAELRRLTEERLAERAEAAPRRTVDLGSSVDGRGGT